MTTTRIPPDFREFLKLLLDHEVRFLLIGGYAVNAFGYVRNTVDMDVWISGQDENRKRVVGAIREFGFTEASETCLDAPDAMLRMGVPPLRIEVMRAITGVEFEDCWPRRVLMEDGDLAIPVISLEDENQQAIDGPNQGFVGSGRATLIERFHCRSGPALGGGNCSIACAGVSALPDATR
ncbi:MAG: hypothetical protein ABI972_24450 [Acidobacteriota bacterium]